MDDRPFDTINVIPFVDIMLVLLAIVLTTSSFIASGRLAIHLPQAPHAEHARQVTRVIELSADGSLAFDGRALAPGTLDAVLQSVPRATPILVRADQSLPLQRFVEVVDTLKGSGFSSVALQTQAR